MRSTTLHSMPCGSSSSQAKAVSKSRSSILFARARPVGVPAEVRREAGGIDDEVGLRCPALLAKRGEARGVVGACGAGAETERDGDGHGAEGAFERPGMVHHPNLAGC